MRTAILLLAWGAGNIRARSGLENIERQCRGRHPGWSVRWAYTSDLLRERLSRARCKSDSVTKALMKLYYEKYQAVAMQPLQVIPGKEHEEVKTALDQVVQATGMRCAMGEPLLASPGSIQAVAKALLEHLPAKRQQGQSVIFMGHGGRSFGVESYSYLSRAIREMDEDVHIGAMNGQLELENLLPLLKRGVVWLLPLLATLGKHAIEDMAGPEPCSWRSRIVDAGFECRPVLTTLVDSPPLARIWLDNLDRAILALPGA